MIRRLIIALVAFGLAIGVTGPKLLTMARISGWLSGAETRSVSVSDKWHETAQQHYRGRNVYWISWGEGDIHSVGPHRLNLAREQWDKLRVGDEVDLISIPGNRHPYVRDGIFVSKGHFAIDIVLVLLEIAVGSWSVFKLIDEW